MKTPQRHPIALNLPRSVPTLITFGRHVVLSMKESAWFASLTPLLADAEAHLDALGDVEAETHNRAKGTVERRDLARKSVEDDLLALKDRVRHIACQNPGEAALVIAAAGFTSKRFTRWNRPEIEVLRDPAPGRVRMRCRSAGRGVAYEWQMSRNGGADWVDVALTTVANTSVSGLAVGETYLFRFRATVDQTTGPWSQIVAFYMH